MTSTRDPSDSSPRPSTWRRLRSGVQYVLAAGLILPALWVWAASFGGLAATADADRSVVLEQLAFLRRVMHEENAARRMQVAHPEGACFLHTLYGLAWANVGRSGDDDVARRARVELEWAVRRQEDPVDLQPFGRDTQVRRGIFWLGQHNLLLAELMGIGAEDRDPELEAEFHRNSAELAAAFEAAGGPLETYDDCCWPCDSVAAVVSLALHDRLYGSEYGATLDAFLDWAHRHADPGTGMLPGRVEFGTWQLVEPARGCANSWNLALFSRVAPEFARAEYARTMAHLFEERLGFRVFREWPRGDERAADVDSGPVVWGAGVTATGVGLATARAMGDVETADDIESLAAMFGLPLTSTRNGVRETRYLLGAFPIGDAFLAFARSVPLAASDTDRARATTARRILPRWPFHLIAALWCTGIVAALCFDRRRLRLRRAADVAAADASAT